MLLISKREDVQARNCRGRGPDAGLRVLQEALGVLGTQNSGSPASVGLVEATAPSCSCLVLVCPIAYSGWFSSLSPLSVPSGCSLSLWP